MDSESTSQSDPLLGLVSHVNRSPKSQMSKLQLTIPIVLRARLARASKDHNIPQLALIRTAISAYLDKIESRFPPDETTPPLNEGTTPEASLGAPSPAPGSEPDIVGPGPTTQSEEGTRIEPEPEPVMEPEQVQAVPEQSPAPKRSRKKGGKS